MGRRIFCPPSFCHLLLPTRLAAAVGDPPDFWQKRWLTASETVAVNGNPDGNPFCQQIFLPSLLEE